MRVDLASVTSYVKTGLVVDNRYNEAYSVVIPLYRSELTIEKVVAEVEDEFARIGASHFEIILVNDCSPDNVIEVASRLAMRDDHIIVLDLAKNVGQSQAVMAGLRQATGDFIITMDDDMQTPGSEIGNLIDAIHDRDDDIVYASYDDSENKRSLIRKIGTRVNWFMEEKLAGKPKGVETNSFRIMRKFVNDAFVQYSGHDIYSFGILFQVTSRVSNLRMKHRPRAVGRSGYTLKKLIDIWVTGAISFSRIPLRTAAFVGFVLMLVSIIGMIVAVIIHRFYVGLFWGLALILSIQLLAMGLMGEYIARLFSVGVNLPPYSIRRIITKGDFDSSVEDQVG